MQHSVVLGGVAFAESIVRVLSTAMTVTAIGLDAEYRRDSGMHPSYFADIRPGEVPACDWLILAGWPHRVGAATIAKARLGAIGTHCSLLPERRGGAPLNWAIIDGLPSTGVTIMELDEAVDAGPVVWQDRIAIGPDETVGYVLETAERALVRGFRHIIPDLLAGKLWSRPQNPAGVSYTRRRTPADGEIDWHQTSAQIHNLVRGLSRPFPGARSGGVTIWKTARVYGERPFGPPGTVRGDLVATGDYLLRIVESEGLDGDNTRLLGAPRR